MRNMYGVEMTPARTRNTGPIPEIADELRSLGVRVETEWAFDVTGERRQRFDLAAFAGDSDVPALLVEWDGAPHFDPAFYAEQGNRPCRNRMHVLDQLDSDVSKLLVALRHGVPLVRLNDCYLDVLPDLVKILAHRLVFGCSTGSAEADVIGAMERGGWSFPYVSPHERTRAVEKALEGVETRCDVPGTDALCEGCVRRTACLATLGRGDR